MRWIWKATGGKKGGQSTLGKCVVASGLVEFFGGCDWIIWLGADNCRLAEFGDYQIEALLYHELLHCELAEKGDTEIPAVRGHDFEGFGREIERYGFWRDSMERAKQAVQGRLDMDLKGGTP